VASNGMVDQTEQTNNGKAKQAKSLNRICPDGRLKPAQTRY
jgi:hypothetical protein